MKKKRDWSRIATFICYFIVGFVVVPLMTAGTTDALRGVIGILAALVGGVITGIRIGKELK